MSEVKAYLKCIIGNMAGHYYPIYKSKIIIGRNTTADINIENANVSRNHLSLSEINGIWFAFDLGGINGTYVNNRKLVSKEKKFIEYGSTIFLGPPSDAPIAFSFLKNTDGPLSTPSMNSNGKRNYSTRKVGSKYRTQKQLISMTSNNKFSKSNDKPSVTNSASTCMKNTDGFESDSSISSLDSLKTRMRKYSAGKETKKRIFLSSDDEKEPSCSSKRYKKSLQILKSIKYEIDNSISSGNFSFSKDQCGLESESLLNSSIEDNTLSSQLQLEAYDSSCSSDSNCENGIHSKRINTGKKTPKNDDSNVEKIRSENERLNNLAGELSLKVADLEQKKQLMTKIIEDELLCNICTEILIKPITLGCSHTFCDYCINEWKKKKSQCPICREKIITKNNVFVLDSVINKLITFMDNEYQTRREDVIKTRLESKKVIPKKRGRKTSRRQMHASHQPMRNNASHQPMRNTSAAIEQLNSVYQIDISLGISGTGF